MALWPARLPDPVVGLRQIVSDVLDDGPPARPVAVFDLAQSLGAEEHHRRDLAVDVELKLLRRRVADADRCGALVAGQVRQLELGQAPLAPSNT